MTLASTARLIVSSDDTATWLKCLFLLPTVIALAALAIVLVRERRRRRQP